MLLDVAKKILFCSESFVIWNKQFKAPALFRFVHAGKKMLCAYLFSDKTHAEDYLKNVLSETDFVVKPLVVKENDEKTQFVHQELFEKLYSYGCELIVVNPSVDHAPDFIHEIKESIDESDAHLLLANKRLSRSALLFAQSHSSFKEQSKEMLDMKYALNDPSQVIYLSSDPDGIPILYNNEEGLPEVYGFLHQSECVDLVNQVRHDLSIAEVSAAEYLEMSQAITLRLCPYTLNIKLPVGTYWDLTEGENNENDF